MAETLRARLAVRDAAHHGEGPIWSARDRRLYWLDMLAGDVCFLDRGHIQRRRVGATVACIRESATGFVAGADEGFALLDPSLTVVRRIPAWRRTAGVRMNEGGVDRAGRFYCGGMSDAPEHAALYRLGPDLVPHPVLVGISTSNGLVFPESGGALHVDSPTRTITRYADVEGERWSGGTPFAVVEEGEPDGIALDAEGGLWVAVWDGGVVLRYDPAGRITHRVELSAPRPTACAFDDHDQLWITTSAIGGAPLGGSIFAVESPIAGAPLPLVTSGPVGPQAGIEGWEVSSRS